MANEFGHTPGPEAPIRHHRGVGVPYRQRQRGEPHAGWPSDAVLADGTDQLCLRRSNPGRLGRRHGRRLLPPPPPPPRARPSAPGDHSDIPQAADELPHPAMGPRSRERRLHAPRVPRRRKPQGYPGGCRHLRDHPRPMHRVSRAGPAPSDRPRREVCLRERSEREKRWLVQDLECYLRPTPCVQPCRLQAGRRIRPGEPQLPHRRADRLGRRGRRQRHRRADRRLRSDRRSGTAARIQRYVHPPPPPRSRRLDRAHALLAGGRRS